VAGVQVTVRQVSGMVSKELMAGPVFLTNGHSAIDNLLAKFEMFSNHVEIRTWRLPARRNKTERPRTGRRTEAARIRSQASPCPSAKS
jgi:hypothetical protein